MPGPATGMGRSPRRREDPRLLTGQAAFLDDISLPDQCVGVFVRSSSASAALGQIRTGAALAAPGVVAVFTGADLAGRVAPVPLIRRPPGSGAELPALMALASDRVRFAGEPIALVVAESRPAAVDAAGLVEIEYRDDGPPVTDIEAAVAPGAPRVHASFPANVVFQSRLAGGDADAAFDSAEVVVRQRLVNHRVAPVPVEPRGCLARYDRLADRLTVWLPTQRAHHTRWFVSQIVGVPEHRVRVVVPDVGGAFGSKEPMYPDEVAVTHAAIALGRPVKWVEDRSESFLATTHGRDQVADLEVAAERDGTITAIRGTIHADMGAYLYPNSSGTVLARTGPLLCGAYTISNIAVDIYGVFTNTTPLGPYRGAGRPEATYYIERLVDLVARALDLDPAEVRRRNFVGPGAFPYGTATGLTYDSGDYGAALDRALERVGYEDVRAEQRAGGTGGTRVGIGLSSYVEIGGVLPSRLAHLEGSPGLWETAVVRVHPTGALTVAVGTCDHGQGHATTFAQIVSDVLGVALGDIDVVYGDTDTAPFGFGTFGSRSAAVGGSAVHLACEKVRDKARQVAARMLESAVEDVECCQGSYFVRGSPARSLSFADIARESMLGVTDRGGETPGLDAEARFDPPNYTFSSGTHACVVEIDGETGLVRVRRYVAVDDCGRAINPMIVEGQIHGGIAQGVGQALLEEVRYDEIGQLLTATLADYALPTADVVPAFETDRVESPSPVNALGVKGVGESGAIAATPAVANAVLDALRPLGIRHLDMPFSPERLWRAMEEARSGGAQGG